MTRISIKCYHQLIPIDLHGGWRRFIYVRQHRQRVGSYLLRFGIAFPIHLAHEPNQFGHNQLAIQIVNAIDQTVGRSRELRHNRFLFLEEIVEHFQQHSRIFVQHR